MSYDEAAKSEFKIYLEEASEELIRKRKLRYRHKIISKIKGKIQCSDTSFEKKTGFINTMVETEMKFFGTGLMNQAKNLNEVQIQVKKNENKLKRMSPTRKNRPLPSLNNI